jgi:hypothetical protein
MAWLNAYGPQEHRIQCALWLPPGGRRQLHEFADYWGNEAMFEDAIHIREFEPRVPFTTAGFKVEACSLPLHLTAFGLRVTQRDARVLGRLRSHRRAGPAGGRRRPFQCEGTLADSSKDGHPRGRLSAEEALAAADGPILLTYRPAELPAPGAFPSQPTVSSSKSREAR